MSGKRKFIGPTPFRNKKKPVPAIDEIVFDFDARKDYLSGFHKRKQQRVQHAREEAAKKDRVERIAARKTLRESRKADLEKHVEAVNFLLKKVDEDFNSLTGEGDEVNEGDRKELDETAPIDEEAVYVDEDRHTTVTIEAVDVTRDGLHKVMDEGSEEDIEDKRVVDIETSQGSNGKFKKKTKPVSTTNRPGEQIKKRKKFRYESKADRKVTRHKERSNNKARAMARKR